MTNLAADCAVQSRLLVLTDRTQSRGDLIATVAVAVERGARAVVLREKDLPRGERARLAAALRELLDPVGGVLIVAGASDVDGAGLQLAAAEPFPARRPAVIGRSCHDVDEVRRAVAEGSDYVTVSPVNLTDSKPGYGPALGTAGLAVRCGLGVPVYALGGIRPGDVPGCLAAGAHGVAVMGAIMRDPDLAAEYLTALSSPQQP